MEGGRWGLVIIFAAFMIQVLAFGVTSAVGVYNIEFLDYFDGATIGVALIGSLNFGIFLGSAAVYLLFAGPIVSFLMTRFSYRRIALFGSVLIIIGLLGMPLLPYIPALCVCFGLLAGFGSSCAYIPSHVLSGLYYDKHRSLATGIATSGSGLGGAIMPVVTGLLIEHYSWKGSLIFVAGLCLHLLVFCSLLRDPPSMPSMEVDISPPEKKVEKIMNVIEEEVDLLPETCIWKPNGVSHDTIHDHLGNDATKVSFLNISNPSSNENLSNKGKLENSAHQVPDMNGHTVVGHEGATGDTVEGGVHLQKKCHHIAVLPSHHSISMTSLHSVGCIRGASQVVVDNNLLHLSSKSVNEILEKAATERKAIPKSSQHIYIFTHYGFDVYFASNIMWNAGSAIMNAFAPEFLTEKGLDPMEAAWYSGVYGFGCFIGGVLGGVFGNFKWINRNILYTVSNIVMGVTLIIFPHCEERSHYLICLVIAGIAFGIILGLLIIVLTDLIGVESLGNGLGYLMLSNGLGTFIGPPMAGLVKESTGGFKEGIILSGVLCVFGGLIMFLMPCKWNWCRRKKAEK